MRHAGRAIGKYLGAGLAGSAKAAVTGGLAYYGQKALAQRVTFLQQHPLAGPAAMIILGHVAKRKFPTAGTALIGAGTYGAALARDMQSMSQPAAAAGTNALISPDDIRALISPSDIRGYEGYESDGETGAFANPYGESPGLGISNAMALST